MLNLILLVVFQVDVSFEEKKILTVKPGPLPYMVAFSPDGRRAAYVVKLAKTHVLVVSDGTTAEHSVVWAPEFSDNGKSMAYVAADATKFSETGYPLDGKWFVVVDGKKGPEFDEVQHVECSIDGTVWAYRAREGGERTKMGLKGGKAFVVVNGKRGEEFSEVWEPIIASDGKTVAFAARTGGTSNEFGMVNGGTMCMVVNGEKGEEYDEVRSPVFSADGKRMAYFGRKGKQIYLIADGKKSPAYEWAKDDYWHMDSVTFSPDGKSLAYVKQKGDRQALVVNDKEGAEYSLVHAPVFSADGSTFAYSVEKGGKPMPGGFFDGATSHLVVGERVSEAFPHVFSPMLSRDGKTVVFTGSSEDLSENFIVVNGKKGPNYGMNLFPTISPDGKVVAYKAEKRPKRLVVVGDKEHEFDHTFSLHFSADSKKLAFGAILGRDFWWKVLDVQ